MQSVHISPPSSRFSRRPGAQRKQQRGPVLSPLVFSLSGISTASTHPQMPQRPQRLRTPADPPPDTPPPTRSGGEWSSGKDPGWAGAHGRPRPDRRKVCRFTGRLKYGVPSRHQGCIGWVPRVAEDSGCQGASAAMVSLSTRARRRPQALLAPSAIERLCLRTVEFSQPSAAARPLSVNESLYLWTRTSRSRSSAP
jgi:hypothetical protein